MKNSIYFLTLCFGILMASCGEPKDDVSLTFKLEYEDQPLVLFQDYNYPSGQKYQFQRISFFISDLTLSSVENGNTTISEVEYLDLTDSHLSAETAATGYKLTKENTGVDSYEGISFNIGLNANQNQTVPEDYTSSNPLSDSAEYWRSWGSYVFFKIEGKFDMNGDGEYGAGEAFQLHLGTDESMRSFSTNTTSEETIITIAVDEIFSYGGNTYDIVANPRLHSLTPEILESMDYLATGIGGAFKAN